MSGTPTPLPASVMEILRCPETRQPLIWNGAGLTNEAGDRRYRLIDDVPLLLVPGRTLFEPTGRAACHGSREIRGRLRSSLRRRLTSSAASRCNHARLADLLRPRSRTDETPRRVLIVGGGILGFGMEELLDRPWLELVETDVYLGPRTSLVCDAHDLPFADGGFDAIVIQAVLEHVLDPARVVAEAHRILTHGGLIYSEVPFMQQVHEGAYDFTRWTLTGHRWLLRDFEEIDAGAVGGPGEALAWSLRYYALALAGGSNLARPLARGLARALTLPLKWSDRLLGGRPAALDAAAGTYFLGRRSSTPRTDAAVVAAHRGAIGAPSR